MRYWLVMPAAGSARRFGRSAPKQYALVQGRTVIEWALAPFLSDPRCMGAVVVLAPEDSTWPRIAGRLSAVKVAVGGAERSQSVRNGLALLAREASPEDWVLVHDAARPCIGAVDRDRLLERAQGHICGGLLAMPLTDTLKAADAASGVERTLDRAALWRAQTPQMFRYAALCHALDAALATGRNPTDEAQALEWAGEHPLLVEGSPLNIKITKAEDLRLAEAILSSAVVTP